MKPDRNFRLHKQAKRDISRELDPVRRRDLLEALIDAQLTAARKITPRELKQLENTNDVAV